MASEGLWLHLSARPVFVWWQYHYLMWWPQLSTCNIQIKDFCFQKPGFTIKESRVIHNSQEKCLRQKQPCLIRSFHYYPYFILILVHLLKLSWKFYRKKCKTPHSVHRNTFSSSEQGAWHSGVMVLSTSLTMWPLPKSQTQSEELGEDK